MDRNMDRKVVALIVVLVLLATGAAYYATQEDAGPEDTGNVTAGVPVQWLWDWSEASSLAQAENKPIMINFYTDMCPMCRKLDQDVFANEEISAFLNDNFICLKSNAGKTNLAANYSLIGVPTTVFTTPQGDEMGRILGAYPIDQFYQGTLQVLDIWNSSFKNQGS